MAAPKCFRPVPALPHASAPVLTAGAPLDAATYALVLTHGRGADAEGMLDLAGALALPSSVAVLAPQADGGTWYPYRFLEPTFENEPWLSGALACVARVVASVEAAGIPSERIIVGGFSQGACLALEYAMRHGRRYAGLLGFSGGMIGPEGQRWPCTGDFAGTPALLACHDADPHIPLMRVEETARALEACGARIDARLYRGNLHTITPDAIRAAQALVAEAFSAADTRP